MSNYTRCSVPPARPGSPESRIEGSERVTEPFGYHMGAPFASLCPQAFSRRDFSPESIFAISEDSVTKRRVRNNSIIATVRSPYVNFGVTCQFIQCQGELEPTELRNIPQQVFKATRTSPFEYRQHTACHINAMHVVMSSMLRASGEARR
jgi:hypothetical protein